MFLKCFDVLGSETDETAGFRRTEEAPNDVGLQRSCARVRGVPAQGKEEGNTGLTSLLLMQGGSQERLGDVALTKTESGMALRELLSTAMVGAARRAS